MAIDSIPETKCGYTRLFRREYSSWRAAISRCYNTRDISYQQYGATGITMCDRWRMSFHAFLSDMGTRPDGKTLDRINGALGYTPENCRWATQSEQSINRSVTRWLTINGVTKAVTEWSRERGIAACTIIARINRGWAVERAVIAPPRRARVYEINGDTITAREACGQIGIGLPATISRLNRGWRPGDEEPVNGIMVSYNGTTMSAQAWDNHLGFKRGTIAARLRRGWDHITAVTQPRDAIVKKRGRPPKKKAHLLPCSTRNRRLSSSKTS